MLTFENDGLTKDQMLSEYTVLGFAMYLCVVERKSDGVRGTLDFSDVAGVRYYYDFKEA
jgi:hypothetical protein